MTTYFATTPDNPATTDNDPTTTFDDEGVIEITGTIGGKILVENLSTGDPLFKKSPDDTIVSGTGQYVPFLRVNSNGPATEGYNTDAGVPLNGVNAGTVNAIHLSDLPIVIRNGVAYYEIRLDTNEPNGGGQDLVALSAFQIYVSSQQASATTFPGTLTKVFDLGAENKIVLDADAPGSGNDDYVFYVPASTFAGVAPGTDPFVTLYAKFGPDPAEDAGFEEFGYRLAPALTIDKTVLNVTNDQGTADTGDDTTAQVITKAGDVVHYCIAIDNTGNQDLTSVQVTDSIEGGAFTGAMLLSGDADNDGMLDRNETWVYGVDYTVTQADIDNDGYGNSLLDNTGRVITAQTPAQTDTATVDIVYTPHLTVTKTFVDVTDFVNAAITEVSPTTDANEDGDIINFTITVKNDGNVTLKAPTIADMNAVVTATTVTTMVGTFNAGDADQDGLFDVGETWRYAGAHKLTQAEIDAKGNDSADGADFDIDNLAIATASPLVLDTGEIMDDDDASAPIVYAPSLDIQKDVASVTNAMAIKTKVDAAGDVINYTITVANTGNVTLTGVTVADDTFSDSTPVYVSGDNGNMKLDVGETWTYAASHTVTQDELDAGGNADGDDADMLNDQFKNTATATSNEAKPDSDDASVDTVLDPKFTLAKVISGVDGGVDRNAVATVSTADDSVNSAGDKIHYTITLANTGNVTLTAVSLTDLLDGKSADFLGGSLPAGLVLDGAIAKSVDADGDLDVGETWTINATYTVSQKDIDTNGGEAVGPPPAPGFIDNVADATAQFRGTIDVPAVAVATPIVYDPKLTIEKQVFDTNTNTWVDADSPTGPTLATGAAVQFRIIVVNTGNVSLTGVVLTDTNYTGDSTLTVGTAIMLPGAVESGASDPMYAKAGVLDVGETWTVTYTQPFDYGQHVNKATVDTDQTNLEFDLAHYTSLQPGPGVRTPGFWTNLGAQFYDGNANNQTKVGPNFADHELTVVDVNGDGKYVIGAGSPDKFVTYNGVVGGTKGLLIGDYNMNGVTDGNEDTIFISSDQAKTILNASNKDQGDTRYVLARDVIATWLNYLAGNPIDNANPSAPFSTNPLSPKGYLDDAIDWLQKWAPDTDNNGLSTSDLKAGGAIGASTAKWQTDRSYVSTSTTASENHNVDGTGKSTDYTGAQLHAALDHYNNDGNVADGAPIFANDGDGAFYMAMMHTTLIA